MQFYGKEFYQNHRLCMTVALCGAENANAKSIAHKEVSFIFPTFSTPLSLLLLRQPLRLFKSGLWDNFIHITVQDDLKPVHSTHGVSAILLS